MQVSTGSLGGAARMEGVDVHLEVTTDEELACHFDGMWMIEALV